MQTFVAYSLIGSALDEVLAQPSLLKHAATDPDAELLDYLEKHAGELKAEVDGYCLAWWAGFRQKLAEAGLEKTAQLFTSTEGLAQTNPGLAKALEVGRFGGYFVPVLGTGLMWDEALGNVRDMLSAGKTWKQRLGSGASGLMNAGLGALALIPGGGIVGASLKAGKLAKLFKLLGGAKGTLKAQELGSRALQLSRAPMTAMLQAANPASATGTSMLGKTLRFAGFNPAYKPWFGSANPHQYLQGMSNYSTALQNTKTPEAALQFTQRVRSLNPPSRLNPLSWWGRATGGGVKAVPAGTRHLPLSPDVARAMAKKWGPEYAQFAGAPPSWVAASMGGARRTFPLMMAPGLLTGGPARTSQPLPWGPGHPQYEQALRRAMSN